MKIPSRRSVLIVTALGSLSCAGTKGAWAQVPVPASLEAKPSAQTTVAAAGAPPAPMQVQKSQSKTAAPVPAGKGFQFFLTERLRVEDYNWWPTDKANGAYTFLGSMLRFGVTRQTPRDDFFLELENPTLVNLPTRAIASAPQGQLGQGASYFAGNGAQVASLFPKQLYFRFKDPTLPGRALKLGRFEYSDGGETIPADPALLWLKKNRIAERLIGPFGFTHIGRSFDGFEFAGSRKTENVTLFGAMPTRGVFDLNGGNVISTIYKSRDSLYSYLELNYRY